MTTVNHSLVQAGSRHAIHNIVYANRTAREADTTLTAADVNQIAFETATGTHWLLYELDPGPVWLQVFTARAADELKLDIQEGGLRKYHYGPIELIDGAYYDTPEDIAGFATFLLKRADGNTAHECAKVFFNNGNIDSIYLSANSALSDTASSFCVFDNGSGLRIKNNMGYTADLVIDMNFTYNAVI